MDDSLKANIISIILKKFPETTAVYQFGSFGTPHETSESDVDLAFLHPPSQTILLASASNIWDCSTELSELLHKDVDLICFNDAAGILQKTIITEGHRLYCSDPNTINEFETNLISDYLAFSETRELLKQDFVNRLKGNNV